MRRRPFSGSPPGSLVNGQLKGTSPPFLHTFWSYLYEQSHAEGFAENDGTFTVPCPGYGLEINGFISLENSLVEIVPNTVAGGFSVSPGCGYEVQMYVTDVAAARTWVNALDAIPNSATAFGSRSKVAVEVNVVAETCDFQYWLDKIRLSDDTTHDCIWGAFGMWAFAHEYGHAVHEELGGGLVDLTGNECSAHLPGLPVETLACAYNEGFADYHGFITKTTVYGLGDHANYSLSAYENNSHYSSGMDGSRDEGPMRSGQ